MPELRKLTADLGMTSRLAILDDGYAVVVGRVDAPGSIRFDAALGRREMPHCSAVGKALLAAMPRDEARRIAQTIMQDKSRALDTLAREELGIDPNELGGSAWVAGSTSFLLFAAGAVIPILPFFFLSGAPAILLAAVLSGAALFGIGVGITIVTGQGALRSGVRQLAFGLVAAAITYGVGTLLGVAIS
jgi:VIT1/CCC1 family predicted Fe2+/Mn2+ transporter